MIRGLALQEFTPRDFFKIIRKEALSAAIIALCIAAFGFIWFSLEQYLGIVGNSANVWTGGEVWGAAFAAETFKTAGLVAGTLGIAIFLSKMVAVLLPMGAAAIKKDPAIVSQPLLTTIVDVSSLLIYFGFAALLFNL